MLQVMGGRIDSDIAQLKGGWRLLRVLSSTRSGTPRAVPCPAPHEHAVRCCSLASTGPGLPCERAGQPAHAVPGGRRLPGGSGARVGALQGVQSTRRRSAPDQRIGRRSCLPGSAIPSLYPGAARVAPSLTRHVPSHAGSTRSSLAPSLGGMRCCAPPWPPPWPPARRGASLCWGATIPPSEGAGRGAGVAGLGSRAYLRRASELPPVTVVVPCDYSRQPHLRPATAGSSAAWPTTLASPSSAPSPSCTPRWRPAAAPR